jgi:hypothetical protein
MWCIWLSVGLPAVAQVSTNQAVLVGGSFRGNIGGFTGQGNDEDLGSIHGLRATGGVVISNGTFLGGDGYTIPIFPLVGDGGSGLYITGGTNSVVDGAFAGGASWNDVLYEDGWGIYQLVEEGAMAQLSLSGGVVSNGLAVDAGATAVAELEVGSGVLLDGAVTKLGDGDLLVENWQTGTLQRWEVEEGSVAFDTFYALEANGSFNVNNSNAVVKFEAGARVDGSVVGSGGARLEVADLFLLGGTLTSMDVVLNGSSNILRLTDDTYEAAGTVFYATNSGLDTLAFSYGQETGADQLNLGSQFVSFERVELADGAVDVWELTTLDAARTDFLVDGGDGLGDMLGWRDGGTYSNAVFTGVTNYNQGFERFGLSQEDDVWVADVADSSLGTLDAREGVDEIDFEQYQPGSEEIGAGRLYQNFEGATLSSVGGEWDATNRYGGLDYLDASGGAYALSFESFSAGITTNAGEMGSDKRFRNFDNVRLSDAADGWQVEAGADTALSFIDAGDGDDMLSGELDSSASIGAGLKYRGFEQVALTDENNRWNITVGDGALTVVNALGGTDTVVGDLSSAASLSGSGLYQGFERVELTSGANQWNVSTDDEALSYVNAVGGVDTLSFAPLGSGLVTNSSALGSGGRYRNFEQVELTSGADRWQWSALNDSALSRIDGAVGSDTLEVDVGGGSLAIGASEFSKYNSFETLDLQGGTFVLSSNSFAWAGTYLQGSSVTLSLLATTNAGLAARIAADDIIMEVDTAVRLEGESPSQYSFGNRYTNQILSASNALTLDESRIDLTAAEGFSVKEWYQANNSLFAVFDRRSLSDPTNGIAVTKGSQLNRVLDEIDQMNSGAAARMVDRVFSDSVDPTAADLNDVYGRTVAVPRAMSHFRNGVFRSLSDRATERRMLAPFSGRSVQAKSGSSQEGAGGSIWMKSFTASGTSSQEGETDGYDLTGVGLMLGSDWMVGEWVMGVAGGALNQTMVMDREGEYTGAGNHVSGYLSYGAEGWFFESCLSVVTASMEYESEGVFVVETDYGASDMSFYLGTGYMMRSARSAWIPEIGLLVSSYSQDAATDSSIDSVPVDMESLSLATMQMRLGLLGVFRRPFIGRELLTQVKARWMNQMSVSEDEVDYRLADGTETYQLPLLTPAKSLLEFGLSAQLRMNRSFSLLMGFDIESGGGYSANRLSAGLRYNF